MEFTDKKVNSFMKLIAYSVNGASFPALSREEWDDVFLIAERQNLSPLFYEAAMHDELLEKDRAFRENLYIALVNAAEQDAKTEAFLNLYSCFTEKNCFPTVVKGILCRRLYAEKGSFRMSGDEDIIISVDEYNTVEFVLNEQGYQLVIDEEDDLTKYDDESFYNKLEKVKELTYYNEQNDLRIEVHINPFGVRNQVNRTMNQYFEEALSRCIFEDINGVSIKTYSHTDHLLFLILHAFKHFIYSGFGLRMALDIAMYLKEYYNDCDLQLIDQRLKEINADKLFYDIIYIANNYWGFSFPDVESVCPDELIDDMINSGTFGNEEEGSSFSAVFTTAAVKSAENGKHSNSKSGTFFRMAFPGKEWLYSVDPKAKGNPLRVISVYCSRMVKGVKYISKHNTKNVNAALDTASNRLELLKKYEIV